MEPHAPIDPNEHRVSLTVEFLIAAPNAAEASAALMNLLEAVPHGTALALGMRAAMITIMDDVPRTAELEARREWFTDN